MFPNARLDLDSLLIHHDFVRRLARALARDGHDAEDLAQDAWIAALRTSSEARAIVSPRGLLATIVHRVASNIARGERRRDAHERRIPADSETATPDRVLERESLRRRVVEAVLALDEPYRSTVLARFFDDRSPREIAKRDGVPVETVRTRLKRAQERLRGALESEFGAGRGYRGALWTLGGAGWNDGATIVLASSTGKIVTAAAAIALVILGVRLVAPEGAKHDPGPAAPFVDAIARDDSARDETSAAPTEARVGPEPATSPATERAAVASEDTSTLTTWRGRLVDRSGKPIAGAEIRLVEPGERVRGVAPERKIASVLSDAEGRFELVGSTRNSDGDEKRFRYPRVLAKGYATTRLERFGHEGRAGDDIVLVEATTLRGRVLDQHGAPVSDSSVVVEGTNAVLYTSEGLGPHAWLVVAATRSDRDGTFVLEGVPADWVRVHADADQGRFFRSEPIPVAVERSSPPLEVRVLRAGDADRLVVDVRDADGRTIPNATLRHHATHRDEDGDTFEFVADVVADDAGRFTCVALDGEDHRFDLRFRETVVGSTPVLRRGAKPVTLTARRVVASSVCVRDDAGSVPGNVVVSMHGDGSSGPMGRPLEREGDEWPFVAPAATFRLSVKSAGFHPEELGPFESSSTPPRIEVTLRRARGVFGIVRDASGPVADALVLFERRMGGGATKDGLAVDFQPDSAGRHPPVRSAAPALDVAWTDEFGRFEIQPSFPGEVILRVDAAGYPPHTLEPFEFEATGSGVERNVELVPGGAIEGRVICGDGGSPAGLFVIAGRGHEEIYETVVAEDGRYRLDDLPLGHYEVAVREVRDTVMTSVQGRVNARDVRATVVSGGVARCDLEFATRAKVRIEGRVTFSGSSRPERIVTIVDRETAIDFDSDLLSIGRLLSRISFESRDPDELDPRGAYSIESSSRVSPRLVVSPRMQSNFYPGHYEFGIRLDEPVVSFVVDIPVGAIEVRIPPSWKSLPNHAIALWRGDNDDLALIGAESRENRVFRFVDVPAGNVRVQIGKFDQVVAVREGETTIVDAE